MKREPILLCLCVLSIIIFGCRSEGSPSPIGEMITIEQVANIPEDDYSWNGKLVAVKGYVEFNSMLIKIGRTNSIKILNGPGGKKIITAKIWVQNADRSEGISIGGGEKSRNYMKISPENLDITTAKFMTDDYQELEYSEFIISGEMIYDNNGYYLENITIHLPK